MKNKKLFAILTLVCFMMTLMPVAAFATTYTASGEVTFTLLSDGQVKVAPASDEYLISAASTSSATATVGAQNATVTVSAVNVAANATFYLSSSVNTASGGASADALTGAVKIPDNIVADSAAIVAANAALSTYNSGQDAAKLADLKAKYDAMSANAKTVFRDAQLSSVVNALDAALLVAPAAEAYATYAATKNMANLNDFVDEYNNVGKAAFDAAVSVAATSADTFVKKAATIAAWEAYKGDTSNNSKYIAFVLARTTQVVGAGDVAEYTATDDITAMNAIVAPPYNASITLAAAYMDALTNLYGGSTSGTPIGDDTIDSGASYVGTVDRNATGNIKTSSSESDNVGITFTFNDNSGRESARANADVLVWVTESGSTAASTALVSVNGIVPADFNTAGVSRTLKNAVVVPNAVSGQEYDLVLARAGEFTLHAAIVDLAVDGTPDIATSGSTTQGSFFSGLTNVLTQDTNRKTIIITASSTAASEYEIKTVSVDTSSNGSYTKTTPTNGDYAGYYADGTVIGKLSLPANSVNETNIKFKMVDGNGAVLAGKTVKVSTNSSAVTVSDETVTTDSQGQFDIDFGGTIEGEYKVYITCGNFEATITVQVGATQAAYINTIKAPEAPIDLGVDDFSDYIRFNLTDINGNLVVVKDAFEEAGGAYKAGTSNSKKDHYNYVSIVSQPSASTVENSDLRLVVREGETSHATKKYQATIASDEAFVAEGTYTLKVALDNGNYKTVTFEVKEFQTPVSITLEYAAPAVELGSTAYVDKLEYVDANGVIKSAKGKVTLAATGYAVSTFDTTTGQLTVKSDEKYVGNTVNVTAVDERYNLTTTVTLTVADEATALSFSSKTGEVNVNNKITVMLVDGNGNRVSLSDANVASSSVSYVILEKPEGATVSATTASADYNLASAGSFKMNLTSNKIGNVKVQVVAKITKNTTNESTTQQTKYYTGTETFAIGTGATGKVVVMSIGSHEMINNDKTSTIDAAPMIQNNRTFVPFRALAEAFGATVAYDEATQAVTAELNGVTVVMTVGSPVYTVNGEEKTADVAPFISESRTYVPVRFAAEAFGIKVTPTYNPDGTTADILFNL